MEPFVLIILVAIAVGYLAIYRPMFITKPARERKELIAKFEQVKNLNAQLIADLQQFAQKNNALDKAFIEGDTFRKKISELEAARDQIFSDDNYTGLRGLHSKNLDLRLMSKTLDDQTTYHERIQKALRQHKVANH
ncbi:MAG: hypothetical protein J7621_01420 [Niastella sp.]|nr:hypothetical protein [Niastella sp.]